MPDDAYEELSRRLAVLVAKLDSTYDELLEANREQREFNRQQVAINQRVEATLQAIKDLLERGRNGH
jgi:predicted transcriptional regulator